MPDVHPRDGVCHRLDLINETLQQIANAHAALVKDLQQLANIQATCGTIDVNRSYSRAEAARALGVSRRTVDRRIDAGALQAIKNGNTVRIDGASLLRHRTGQQLIDARRVLKL